MLYSVVLVAAMQQHESAISIHYVPCLLKLSHTLPIPPSRSLQSTLLSCLCCTAASHCFTNGNVYVSVLLSQFVPLSPSLCVQKSILCVCIFIPTLQIGSSVLFSRLYVYVCICIYICIIIQYLFFSFLLHSI